MCHDYGSFNNISAMDLGGSAYRQVGKNIFDTKITFTGSVLICGCLAVCFVALQKRIEKCT
jgi:hypothetical protein